MTVVFFNLKDLGSQTKTNTVVHGITYMWNLLKNF